MGETQEQRIERLTELARKVYGPDESIRVCKGYCDSAWMVDCDSGAPLYADSQRALDALEAALRVLAGEPTPAELTIGLIAKAMGLIEHGDCHSIQAEDDEIVAAVQQLRAWQYEHALCVEAGAAKEEYDRAETAERELAELKAKLEALATVWRDQADAHRRHDVQAFCAGHADELRATIGGELRPGRAMLRPWPASTGTAATATP